MDLISYLESLDSPTLDTDYALQSDTSAVPPLPQPSYPNETLSLLDTCCSDADTVQSNLLDIGEFNNQSNEGQQFFDSSIENWFSSNDCNNPSDSFYAIESINSSTLDTDHSSQCDTLAVQPLPRPSYPKRSLALLKAFCSDEDTVKIYLQNDDLNNYNNEGQQFFASLIRNLNSFMQHCPNSTDPNKPSDRMSIIENLCTFRTLINNRIALPENDYKGRKRFNGWIKKDGKKTCIAFASGKVTTTGFKSLADVAVTIKIMFPDYDSFLEKIVSIAVKSFLPYQIDARKLFNEPDIIYEPELFPAALWYYNKICLMFFHTNSIVMNGLQRFSDIEIVLAAFMKRALPFKKV